MPKIIHLITGLTVGGAEQMLLQTVPKLQGEQIVVSIIPLAKIGEELAAAGVNVQYLNLRSFFDIRVPFKLYRLLKKERPDILVTYLLHADILGRIIGRIARVPIIISSIRCAHKDKPLLVWLSKLTAPLAHHFIAVSDSVKQWTENRLHIPAEKITIIHNGVTENLSTKSPELSNIEAQLQLNESNLVITYIGRLDSQKGLEFLIEAISILQATSLPPFDVLLVGDGPQKSELENLVQRNNLSNIKFLGFRRDVNNILQASSIFVSPTLFEGISNAIMEAMASGLPVVTTDIPENKELIDNMQNGIVVPVRDGKALAAGLASLLNSAELRSKLGATAQATIRNNFSINSTIQQLDNLFAKLYVRNCR